MPAARDKKRVWFAGRKREMRLFICGSYAVASDRAVFPVATIKNNKRVRSVQYINRWNRSFAFIIYICFCPLSIPLGDKHPFTKPSRTSRYLDVRVLAQANRLLFIQKPFAGFDYGKIKITKIRRIETWIEACFHHYMRPKCLKKSHPHQPCLKILYYIMIQGNPYYS